MNIIEAYTDGSFYKQFWLGSWAYLIREKGSVKTGSGTFKAFDSMSCEREAVDQVLKALNGKPAIIYCDVPLNMILPEGTILIWLTQRSRRLKHLQRHHTCHQMCRAAMRKKIKKQYTCVICNVNLARKGRQVCRLCKSRMV